MGFWDVAKNVGTVVANGIAEKANEVREKTEQYNELDDDELLRMLKSEGFFGKSPTEKAIAFKILKERGYNPEDMKRT